MPEIVQEYVSSRGQNIRLDSAKGVLRGVKLLGLESRNGRSYQEQALLQAITLYEGAKVNVNHPKGDPLSARDYRDRLGIIRNVQLKPKEGLFGDLHYNPKHALAEQLAWDAEHSPENVGLSHNVLAQTARKGKHLIVEAITKVQSVDLVADPATTKGLYEHLDDKPLDRKKLKSKSQAEEQANDPANLTDTAIASLESELNELRHLNAKLLKANKRLQIQERAINVFAENLETVEVNAGMLTRFLSEDFLSNLTSLDEHQVGTAIKDRLSLLNLAESKTRATAPQSIEQTRRLNLTNQVVEETTESFVAAITRS